MENGTAKEILGKTVNVWESPQVVTGGDTGQRIAPYSSIEFIEIVDDLTHPNDQKYRWFKLPNGLYCTYVYPRTDPSISGMRFDILTMPTESPATGVADVPFSITLGDDVTYEKQTITGTLKAK